MNLISTVGGKGGKDFTNRALAFLLANNLAELCSWTGAKNNFEIQNLKSIAVIFHSVRKITNISAKEFEVNVKDWLRHAKQRRERKEKKESRRTNMYLLNIE